MIALPGRPGLHRQDIRADSWLGHAQAADPLARDGPRQHAAALGVIAVQREVVREKEAVSQHRECEPGVRARQHLHQRNRRGGIETGAAIRLRNRDPQQPQLPGAQEQTVVEGLGAVALGRLGLDLPLDELAQGARQHLVLGAGLKQVELTPVGALRTAARRLTRPRGSACVADQCSLPVPRSPGPPVPRLSGRGARSVPTPARLGCQPVYPVAFAAAVERPQSRARSIRRRIHCATASANWLNRHVDCVLTP